MWLHSHEAIDFRHLNQTRNALFIYKRGVVAHWLGRCLSTGGPWVRIPLCLPSRDLGQVLHSQLSVVLRRETPTQYPCCVGSASEYNILDLKKRYRNDLKI